MSTVGNPIVYAYSGCTTCKRALNWLASRDVKPDVRAIRETPPSLAELRAARQAGIPLRGLFNTSGGTYKEMNLKDRLPSLSEDEALALLAANGNLVKRPFVIAGDKHFAGFHEAEWEAVFGELQVDCED